MDGWRMSRRNSDMSHHSLHTGAGTHRAVNPIDRSIGLQQPPLLCALCHTRLHPFVSSHRSTVGREYEDGVCGRLQLRRLKGDGERPRVPAVQRTQRSAAQPRRPRLWLTLRLTVVPIPTPGHSFSCRCGRVQRLVLDQLGASPLTHPTTSPRALIRLDFSPPPPWRISRLPCRRCTIQP